MTRFDRLALGAAVAVAAVMRFPGIEARGRFDADQGHDMLTLLALTRDGVLPLLGPKTSVGDFHHGAFYYYLLAPSAAISGANPVVVTAFLALLGICAVALTWWLGREIGGPRAGALAAVLLAVSPAGIEESIFIWNPNPIGFFAVLALASAWRARSGGRRGWWAVAIAASGAVVQLHVLGVVFFVAVLAIVLLELRRDRAVLAPLLGGVALVGLLFVPLLLWELDSRFSETQAVIAYLRSGEGSTAGNPPLLLFTFLFTLIRAVGWPFVGLVTDVLGPAALLLAGTLGGAALTVRLVPPPRRSAVKWLVGILAWSTVALAFAAPSLQRVVPGLPNDHYHAFLDPVVIILVAVPLGMLFDRSIGAWRSTRRPISALASVAVGVVVVGLITTSIVRRPPLVDPDGGWPALEHAGERIVQAVDRRTVYVYGLPDFKLPDAISFPIVRAGGEIFGGLALDLVSPAPEGPVVVVCDRLFEHAIGAACGGPAEDRFIAGVEGGAWAATPLLVRFDASPRTAVSIYAP